MLDSHRTWTEISILCVAWSVSHLCEVERQLLLEGFTAWKAAFWCFYVISNVEKKQQVQRNTDPIPPPTMHSVATFITLPCCDLLHHCPLVVRKCSKGPSTLKQTQELPEPWQHCPFLVLTCHVLVGRPLREAVRGEHRHPEKDHQEEDQSVSSRPRTVV